MHFLPFHRRFWPGLLAALLALWATRANAEELVFANDAEPYCPYTNCKHARGYVIDVLAAIYEGYGYTVTIKDLPWNRAVAMADAGKVDGIVGITRDVLPRLVYPHSEVARYMPTVFSLKANPWQYSGVPSLRSIRLGMVENYGNGEGNPELQRYLESKPGNVTYVAAQDAINSLFLMIRADHIDAMIEDRAVGSYVLQESGQLALFKTAPAQTHYLPGYVGFGGDVARATRLARQFDAGLAQLRKSGKLKALLAPYHLSDWR